MDTISRALILGLALNALAAGPAGAQTPSIPLTELSLDELGRIEVTSISKQPEPIRRVSVAITVLTNEDIRRSGATSIPEALRLVPGVEVARIDADHWSVGVRGLGDQFAKSLLVLVDGRSLYTPLFAGTYWPAHDVLLEDVERIEVIRGPGGTVWGARAVTGVINIITRGTRETHGVLATLTSGSTDRAIGALRYGGGNSTTFDYRGYVKAFRRDAQHHPDEATFDKWWMAQGGVRADWTPNGHDVLTVQGDLSDGRHGQRVPLTSISPPRQTSLDGDLDALGANARVRWTRRHEGGNETRLQAYYDWTSWVAPHFDEVRHTLDVDFVQGMSPLQRHSFVWGAGLRYGRGRFTQVIPSLTFTPADDTERIYSAFAQDEIELVPETLTLSAGSKIEHNQYTGVELQPSVRAAWTPWPSHTLWTSINKAARTPSRIERAIRALGLLSPGPPVPIFLQSVGSEAFESEHLIGVEAGYRTSFFGDVTLDVATFHNRHRGLAAFGAATGVFVPTPIPHGVATIPYVNGVDGTSDGIEIAPAWRPIRWWHLDGAYSYVQFNADLRPGTLDANTAERYEGSSPRHQVRTQSRLTLPGGIELDAAYRYTSDLPARRIPAYHSADARAAWRLDRGVDISVTGQNLLQAHHLEFGTDPATAIGISRSVAVTVQWRASGATP
jgi:iron complex outermembrane recepter protein